MTTTVNIETPFEEKEVAAIMRRKELEDSRKERIQDVRYRTMGLDVDGLAAQIQEKKAMESAEKQREEFYDSQRLLVDQQLQYLEQQKQSAMRSRQVEIQQFRSSQQLKNSRREFDLSADDKKHDLPARVGDDDERLSVSGLQQFVGEDLSHASRVKAQMAQMKDWNEQQMAEKAARKAAELQADRVWAARQFEIDDLKGSLESANNNQRSAQRIATAEYNLALAADKRDKDRLKQINDVQDSIEEIQNNLSSDLLNESPVQALSYAAAHRVRGEYYKGMSGEMKQHYAAEQAAQVAEMHQRKMAEKQEDQQWNNYTQQINHVAGLKQEEVEAHRKDMANNLAFAHKQQQQEFKSKTSHLNKVYKNELEPTYFDKFGTSSR